jgi:hypothetical protein
MLRDDSIVLQLPKAMLRKRLLLLHLLQQHASLLRHLRLIEVVEVVFAETKKPRAVDGLAANTATGLFICNLRCRYYLHQSLIIVSARCA